MLGCSWAADIYGNIMWLGPVIPEAHLQHHQGLQHHQQQEQKQQQQQQERLQRVVLYLKT